MANKLSEVELAVLARRVKQEALDKGLRPGVIIEKLGVEGAYHDLLSHGAHHGTNTYGWRTQIQSLRRRRWLKAGG